MKELSIEEKAKRYDEAVKYGQYLINERCKKGTDGSFHLSDLQKMFPELKENEDEKIRQFLIHEIEETSNEIMSYRNMNKKDVIAWLEKQDKNISLPKFTFDDVLALQCAMEATKKVQKDKDLYEQLKSLHDRLHDAYWLIKQGTPAKLSEEEQNRFAKGVLTSCALSFINYLDTHKYEGKMCVSNGECEDIENAFHNAMWDRLHRYYCKYIEKQGEQKPNDKVEPKFHEGDIMRTLEEAKEGITDGLPVVVSIDEEYYHCNNELISIKDQDEYEYPPMNRKQNPAWSEEDERLCQCLIKDQEEALDEVRNDKYGHSEIISDLKEMYNERIDWLKSLKDRVQPQPKQEWSEQDKWMIETICDAFEKGSSQYIWLKSLKEIYTWKPSDEQMEALSYEVDAWDEDSVNGQNLKSLYQDLKKLMEE